MDIQTWLLHGEVYVPHPIPCSKFIISYSGLLHNPDARPNSILNNHEMVEDNDIRCPLVLDQLKSIQKKPGDSVTDKNFDDLLPHLTQEA